jgi:hypothetical protein
VGYSVIRSPSDLTEKQLASYALQENIVTIKETTTGEGDKKKTVLSAETDRQDHNGFRIALLKRGQPGVNTSVTIKKFDNTDIPSEVTVKVDDTRADLIKKVGEVAIAVIKSGLIPFAVAPPPDPVQPKLPLKLNLSQLIGGANRAAFVHDNQTEHYSISYGEIPPDAVAVTSSKLLSTSSYFYYAACRTARVRFSWKGQMQEHTFKVSDPNFLQRERMPVDGKITMHSQCGASVTGKLSSDGASAGLDIAAALVAQGQSIKEALEAAGKEEEE